MSAEVRVDPAALKAEAAAMRQIAWSTPTVQPVPADALPLAKDAVDNLNENARVLTEYQNWAEAENQRIAEMLDNAATVYQQVDEAYKDKIDDPSRQAAIDDITLPAPSTPLPALPDAPAAPRRPDAGGYSDVKKTHGDLSAGDHGASLQMAEVQWGLAGTFVEGHAAPRNITDWEGDAADSAHSRMNAFSDWLHDLSAAWQRLAQAAAKVQASHLNANAQHIPIYTRYVALEAQLAQSAAAGSNVDAIVKELENLQRQSDEVREEYAKNATVDPIRIEDPPGASRGAGSGVGAGAPGRGGGDKPTGDPAAMAQRMGESLGQPTAAAGGKPGGGKPSGGGAPSGGGSPSGGGAPGGAPSGTPAGGSSTGTPKLPTDPSLRPAAAGGGGSGSGGGGGGKGMGSVPLSPAVTAETVAPAPVPVTSAAAGATPGTSGTPMMGGGGMGMAPMGAGAGAQQGKDKDRNPNLAPDEDLYTEDRAWTEGVIGHRRRRDVQDGGDGGEGT